MEQQLKGQMTPCFNENMIRKLFHDDFKFHIEAIALLSEVILFTTCIFSHFLYAASILYIPIPVYISHFSTFYSPFEVGIQHFKSNYCLPIFFTECFIQSTSNNRESRYYTPLVLTTLFRHKQCCITQVIRIPREFIRHAL